VVRRVKKIENRFVQKTVSKQNMVTQISVLREYWFVDHLGFIHFVTGTAKDLKDSRFKGWGELTEEMATIFNRKRETDWYYVEYTEAVGNEEFGLIGGKLCVKTSTEEQMEDGCDSGLYAAYGQCSFGMITEVKKAKSVAGLNLQTRFRLD
jgi:hypothetical protein